jgi:hypothetical protein
VNSLRLGFSRFSRQILPENQGKNVGALLGVNMLNVPERARGFPAFTVAGFSRLGDATTLPIMRHANTYQIVDGLSFIRGPHLFKIGGEVQHIQLNGRIDLLARGSISFSGALSGSGISDLLLGLPSFALQSQADNPFTMRSSVFAAYVQDDWKVQPSLSLNLGLRYEYATPPEDPADRISMFDFASSRVVRAGSEGGSRSGIRPDNNNFAPRVGLAWSARSDTVVRGGYGIYYDSGNFEVNSAQYFNPPQFNLRVYFPTAASLLTLQNPMPSTGGMTPPASLNVLSPNLVTSWLQHWHVTVDRVVEKAGTLSAGYAASRGTHLIRSRDLNQPPPGPGELQARRPLPGFGSILFVESGANSSYHSLQTTFQRPMHRRLSLWAVYTLSKSLDDASAFLSTRPDKNFPQNSSDVRSEWGRSSFDVRHRAVIAHITAFPSAHRWSRGLEMRGILTVQSGSPFTSMLRFDNSNTGNTGGNFGSDRPNLLGNPRLSEPSPERWFDTSAFAVAPRYSFGNAGRNIVQGPGLFTYDLSLAKQIPAGERVSAFVEVQGFNILNHTNFCLPEAYADEPATFGRIFSAKPPRQLQLALRFVF